VMAQLKPDEQALARMRTVAAYFQKPDCPPAFKRFAEEFKRLSFPELSPDEHESQAASLEEPNGSAALESPCVEEPEEKAPSVNFVNGGIKSSASIAKSGAKADGSLRVSLDDFMTKAAQAGQRDQMLRVADVAKLLRMSEKWTRRYFAGVEGVLKFPSPKKRSKRSYSILVIPVAVLAREVKKRTAS